MPLFKHRVKLLEALRKPVVQSLWPLCITCGRLLDSTQMIEGYPGESQFCKVLGKHHGSEELVSFDMGSVEWTHEDLRSHLYGHSWFDPRLVSK